MSETAETLLIVAVAWVGFRALFWALDQVVTGDQAEAAGRALRMWLQHRGIIR